MDKKEATELLATIERLKELKKKLMGWSNKDGYSLDSQMEAYLKGVLEATNG